MATFASRFATGELNLPQPYDGSVLYAPFEVDMPTAALALNDLILLGPLPPGVSVVDFLIAAGQLDSNGTPLLTFSLGTLNATRDDLSSTIESGLTFGRTANGSVNRLTFGAAIAADKAVAAARTEPRMIALKVTAVAATWAGAGKSIFAELALRG